MRLIYESTIDTIMVVLNSPWHVSSLGVAREVIWITVA
jgi:hypothetical protein